MRFSIITGLSGAGRSTALKTFEDMGFYCADNIPPLLIPEFARLNDPGSGSARNVAVVADMRLGDMFDDIYPAIEELRKMPMQLDIIFLDAEDDTLVSRYKQTRRAHPMSGSGKLTDGIREERSRLQRIKELANIVIDTSRFTGRELSDEIERRFSEVHDDRLLISVITFGYKRGIPIDADMVFDMRFLPNPFYKKELKLLTGRDKEVVDFLHSFPVTEFFLDRVTELVRELAPGYIEQDNKQLVIAIGCTGGMHRSVAISEELYERLKASDMRVSLEHRDLKMESLSLKHGAVKGDR